MNKFTKPNETKAIKTISSKHATQAVKFAELLLIVVACILMSAMLTGCNTTQTLAAQFGAAPLPTKVARKLYGTCGYCNLETNCALCTATQNYNRKLAAAPADQKAQFPKVGTSWANHQAQLESLSYQPYGISQSSIPQNPYGY